MVGVEVADAGVRRMDLPPAAALAEVLFRKGPEGIAFPDGVDPSFRYGLSFFVA
jgi:hypothetical protein